MRVAGLAGAGALALLSGQAMGASLYSGDGITISWDNTVKYSTALRLESPDDVTLSNVNGDEGARNFRSGIISNRFDILSDLDVKYENYGFRLSGAAWMDSKYLEDNQNNSPASYNSANFEHDEFSNGTKRLHGLNAEFLEAYVRGKWQLEGDQQLSARIGYQTVLWGESLFFAGNGMAAGQAPIDVVKALSVPNLQAKETFMPVPQALLSWQMQPGLTLEGYYQFEWRKTRLPGVGSYFSSSDILDTGGERLIVGPGAYFYRADDIDPPDGNQFGVAAKFRVGETDFGLYGQQYNAKTPQLYTRAGDVAGNPADSAGKYQLVYAEGIQAFGASASSFLGDANIAGEISYRRRMPLVSGAANVLAGQAADGGDDALFARGDTLHGQVSTVWVTPPLDLAPNGLTILGEVAGNHLVNVDRNEAMLSPGLDDTAAAAQVLVTASYFEVLPQIDIDVPLGLTYNLFGRSSVDASMVEGTGSINIGLKAVFKKTWTGGLTYTHFIGDIKDQAFADRDYLSFVVQTTF
jgi:hypothetical protein